MRFFKILFFYCSVVSVAFCQNGLFGLINPRDIADLTQMAMQLGAQTVKSNQELMRKPGRPEVKPITSDLSPSEIFGQGLTNLMNPEATMKLLNNNQPPRPSPRGPTLPIEKPEETTDSIAELPREFRNFSPERLFSTLQRPRTNAAPSVDSTPVESIAEVGKESIRQVTSTPPRSELPSSDLFSRGLSPEMESSGRSLMKLASSFLRGAGGRSNDDYRPYGRDFGPPKFDRDQNLIPNIREVLPGARENFGVRRGQGCLPFIGEFMQIAYGNCVKHADQKTFDAWGREFESVVTGRGINFFRASKETCRMVAEREQCGQLRKAVSSCDIINSIQIAMNMQRAIERCDNVSGLIDQNPATLVEGMSGLINGEVAQGFLNNFLG